MKQSAWVWFNRSALWMAVAALVRETHSPAPSWWWMAFLIYVIVFNPFHHWLKPEREAAQNTRPTP